MDLSAIFGRTLAKNQDSVGNREMDVAGIRPVLGVLTNDPPSSPTAGDMYIVGVGAGLWAGHDNHTARYTDAAVWTFEVPQTGWLVQGPTPDGRIYRYGAGWAAVDAAALAAVTAEAGTRAAADTVLANAVTSEASTRASADTALSSDIAAEASTRAAADTALSSDIASEASTRAAADTALAAVDTAEAAARLAADTALNDAVVAAQADADALELILATTPTTVLDLYVDPVAGNDANTGLSTSAPIQTGTRLNVLLEAFRVEQYRPVYVHLASGNVQMPAVGMRVSGKPTYPILVHGDPLWDPRGDLFTVINSGTAQASTGAAVLNSTGLTLNALRGYTIEFTSGAAVGQRRQVESNTTTAITPNNVWSPAPASGDTYRIVRCNAVLEGTRIMPETPHAGLQALDFAPVMLCNVELTAGSGVTLLMGANAYQLRGVRQRTPSNFMSWGNSNIQSGVASFLANGMATVFGAAFTESLWTGWGLSNDGTGFCATLGPQGYFSGYVVSNGLLSTSVNTGTHNISGGHIGSIFVNQQSRITMSKGSVGDAADTTTRITLQGGDLQISGAVAVNMTSASNPAIDVFRRSGLLVSASLTGSNLGAGPSLRCRYGGFVSVSGVLNFGRASGDAAPNDIVCEGTAANKTSLSAAGSAIRDASFPESVIRRTA